MAVSILVLGNLIARSEAHGRLLVPPARSSAWREDPARFPSYFDDAQMFCGGFQTQWGVNGMRFFSLNETMGQFSCLTPNFKIISSALFKPFTFLINSIFLRGVRFVGSQR